MFFCDFLKYNGLPVYAMRERVNCQLRMVRCSWIEKAAVDADWSLERKGGMDGGCGRRVAYSRSEG